MCSCIAFINVIDTSLQFSGLCRCKSIYVTQSKGHRLGPNCLPYQRKRSSGHGKTKLFAKSTVAVSGFFIHLESEVCHIFCS